MTGNGTLLSTSLTSHSGPPQDTKQLTCVLHRHGYAQDIMKNDFTRPYSSWTVAKKRGTTSWKVFEMERLNRLAAPGTAPP